MIQRVIALAAMMVTTVERVKGSSVDSIDGTLAEGDENRPPQGSGRSHITGRVKGTHGGNGMNTRGRRSGKEVKPDYK